jgi:hypothetical protein
MRVVSDEMVLTLSATGTTDDVAARISALLKAGLKQPRSRRRSAPSRRRLTSLNGGFKRRAGNASPEDLRAFLADAPDVPPEPGDEIPDHLRVRRKPASARE